MRRRSSVRPGQPRHGRHDVTDLEAKHLRQACQHLEGGVRRRIALPEAAFDLLVMRARQPGLVREILLRQARSDAAALQFNPQLACVRLPGGGRGPGGHGSTLASGTLTVSQKYPA